MEQLIYKNENTTITKEFDGVDANYFLHECVEIMRMLGYSDDSIKEALDNISF